MNNKVLYIAGFLLSVLILQSVTNDTNATYMYLLVVLISVVFYNWNKYKITVTTPEILQ